MPELQPARGTQDLLPEMARRHRRVSDTARELAALYGFAEIATPIFEFTEVFARPIGEHTDIVAKEMYTFTDRGGEEVTLRPENTAGVVRAVLSNGLTQSTPLKFFYSGPMFRYERPQKGRFRQFHQIGVELLGVATPQADIEVFGDGGGERRLQIAAMDRPIGRAVALFGSSAERHAHDFAAAFGAEHAQALGRDDMGPQPLAEPELDQRARGIGRQLDAGAGLVKPLGLLQHQHAETAARDRQRRGQSGNAGASNDDGARGGQGTRSPVRSKLGAWQCAFRRPRGIRRQRRIVAVERRAIGTDVLGVVAHVAEHMGMIERRLGAHAHEFPGADLDDRNARVVVEMGNDRIRHGLNGVSSREHHSDPAGRFLAAGWLKSRKLAIMSRKL